MPLMFRLPVDSYRPIDEFSRERNVRTMVDHDRLVDDDIVYELVDMFDP
jgi:hypothetical protein